MVGYFYFEVSRGWNQPDGILSSWKNSFKATPVAIISAAQNSSKLNSRAGVLSERFLKLGLQFALVTIGIGNHHNFSARFWTS